MLATSIYLLLIFGVLIALGGVMRAALCTYFEQFYWGVVIAVGGLVVLFTGIVLGVIYL